MRETTVEVTNIFPTEFINLSTAEQKVSVNLYSLLAGGHPVPVERIASTVNLSREEVQTILKRWPGVYYDDADRIVGYWGLALAKMSSHLFEVNGKTLYTWCAWDGLFIPAILKSTARITSACPVSGEDIRLSD